MKSFLLISIMTLFLSCGKDSNDDKSIFVQCLTFDWVQTHIQAARNCTCLTELRVSTYQNQVVYEFRLIDPLCNGISVVYDGYGKVLFNSSQREQYEGYLKDAKDSKVVWNCRDGALTSREG